MPFPRRRWLVVVAAGIIAAAWYLFATRNDIIIENFNVPKQWADQGLTGDVVARQIRDALENMEVAGHNSIQADSFVVHADPDPIPDIKLIGTGIGLRSLLDDARTMLNRHISGEFVVTSKPQAERLLDGVVITLRVARHGRYGPPLAVSGPFDSPQSLATATAEALLNNINPFTLAICRYT